MNPDELQNASNDLVREFNETVLDRLLTDDEKNWLSIAITRQCLQYGQTILAKLSTDQVKEPT